LSLSASELIAVSLRSVSKCSGDGARALPKTTTVEQMQALRSACSALAYSMAKRNGRISSERMNSLSSIGSRKLFERRWALLSRSTLPPDWTAACQRPMFS
jgi:hypothetical protein